MVERGDAVAAARPWWKPSPLTAWFFAMIVLDAVILTVASGVTTSDNDAAGNGMANAFRDGFVETGAYSVGLLALLFLLIRRRSIRIALPVLLVPATLFFLLLLQ